jgi:phosphoribosylformylglycinamidine cyclo-ligase
MYKVFNMGHRLEIYLPPSFAKQVIDLSKSFGVDAKIIGRVEAASKKQVTVKSNNGEFVYH